MSPFILISRQHAVLCLSWCGKNLKSSYLKTTLFLNGLSRRQKIPTKTSRSPFNFNSLILWENTYLSSIIAFILVFTSCCPLCLFGWLVGCRVILLLLFVVSPHATMSRCNTLRCLISSRVSSRLILSLLISSYLSSLLSPLCLVSSLPLVS